MSSSDYLSDDNVISMCLHLIHRQWPEVSGEEVLLIQSSFQKAVRSFCQVLHDDVAKHWFAVSKIRSKDGNIRVMDSFSITQKPRIVNALACECSLATDTHDTGNSFYSVNPDPFI